MELENTRITKVQIYLVTNNKEKFGFQINSTREKLVENFWRFISVHSESYKMMQNFIWLKHKLVADCVDSSAWSVYENNKTDAD